MTAAKVIDIISRMPGCAGQAADAVSAKTHVKMEDAPTLWKIPKSECPDIWIRLPRHQWPESWSSMEDPVVPLERNLYGHPLALLLRERQLEKVLLKYGWEKFQIRNVHLSTEKKDYSHLCMWTISNWLERNRTSIRFEKYKWKTLIWENQHHFLTMFILVALKENVRLARILWIITEVRSNQGFCAGATEKLSEKKATGKLDAETISSWSYDMEGHAKKCVERYCELTNETREQLYKVATPCMDDHQFKEEEIGPVGELSIVCSQIVLKCQNLTRFGGPDIFWSVNKLARAVTKWTKACDKCLARLISYIYHTCEYRQYCYVGNSITLQSRIVSRLWFCRRPWSLEVNIRRNSVHFRKSHVRDNKLDVQETDLCFTQFYRSWGALWMGFPLSIFGI